MPIAVAVTIAFQVLCVIHVVRTGRTQPWLFVIVFLPMIGSIAYAATVILPEIADNRRSRKVFSDVATVLDPDREYRDRKAEVELTGTPAAKTALADECLRKGMLEDAEALYRSALTGLYADDPVMLVGLARVLVEKGDFAGAETTLDEVKAKNPDFESTEGHLLYARALEGQGKSAEAAHEFEAVAAYFPGYEAKVRYALFLLKEGQVDRAREGFTAVVEAYKRLPAHAKQLNRDWYEVARRNLH